MMRLPRLARIAARQLTSLQANSSSAAVTHSCSPSAAVAAAPAASLAVRRLSSMRGSVVAADNSAASAAAATEPMAAVDAVPPMIVYGALTTVPAPTLLCARPATAAASSASSSSSSTAAAAVAPPSSIPLRSRAHLDSLDPLASDRPFELTFLGTASGRSSLTRNVSSLALRMGRGRRLSIFDCGEGTARQVRRSPHLSLSALSNIFVTHLHGDHVWGLCALLSESSKSKPHAAGPLPSVTPSEHSADSAASATIARTIHVFGPQGLAEFVKNQLTATHTWVGRPVMFHEIIKNHVNVSTLPRSEDVVYHQARDISQLSFQIFEDASMQVHTAPLKHRFMNCWGYVVTEKLGSAQAAAGALPRRGRKLAVLGDTSDSSHMRDIAQGADVMVHEATFLDAEAEKGLTILKGHSSARMAGAFARSCDVHHLLLTHFSHRYVDLPPSSTPQQVAASTAPHVQQATEALGHQRVYAAQDLQIFHVAAHPPPTTTATPAAAVTPKKCLVTSSRT